jgi:hypothetical protein
MIFGIGSGAAMIPYTIIRDEVKGNAIGGTGHAQQECSGLAT